MEIALIALLSFFASLIGTFAGFGISTIMVPALLFFLPLPATLLLVGVIHFFGNLWKLLLFRKGIQWKTALLFGVSGIFAAALGAFFVLKADPHLLSQILGFCLLAYVLFVVMKPDFILKKSMPNALIGGAASGFFAGIFGIGGVIRSVFLSAYNLPKASFIATIGLITLLVDASRVSVYILDGVSVPTTLLWGLFVFVGASFFGVEFAKLFIKKISQEHFRSIVLLFLFLASIKLLFFA